jgi:hypothetical protein
MISNEQIAHDLAISYLNNRYGVEVNGYFSVSDGDGSGNIDTERLPGLSELKMVKVATGEKGIFGRSKKKWVESGQKVDSVFNEMINEYFGAYSKFLQILNSR